MKPYYEHAGITIYHGDCREVLPVMVADSIVTDPPYGLKFMGKDWDHGVPGVPYWKAVLDALKPGGHLLAFGGTRTYHRLACAIEDAGFEVRDCLMWLYGSGFPKSRNVSKAIDRAAGVKREIIGRNPNARNVQWSGGWDRPHKTNPDADCKFITLPSTDAARQWDGWGTALKPAYEPIILARKPLEGTVVANVLKHGTGGINVDGCKVIIDPIQDASQLRTMHRNKREVDTNGQQWGMSKVNADVPQVLKPQGRWPANVILDEEAGRMLDEQSGFLHGSGNRKAGITGDATDYKASSYHISYEGRANRDHGPYGGGASRFFYCAKASKKERTCSGLVDNDHPTVKPIKLMQYLIRLITPPGGIVLDPFMGSGATLRAAKDLGRKAIGIEIEEKYCEIAAKRLG